ncbi:pyridoxamine 5'-phosphate oxidase-related, FMN-binding [Seminavis robusta]|uniref:Pyridoxamine 5'-phosphate oxidase-related, FMN-binding n=1 Tax=Seminavis robusta TaxID=568900 RepID=A0A9N8DRX8_9STRA|nr:pyridoxamine 5'-phosphate oxidase-related, FMN-binding [Seminavis robusta]|eukprot:Sro210_g087600.1 pyridoxamine 5'-phosphate oxidase-related, FMN-binding (622) ;mRNA; f:34029-35894
MKHKAHNHNNTTLLPTLISFILVLMSPFSSSFQGTKANGESLYPSNWPAIPFHKGEVAVQKKVGTHDFVMSYAPRMIRPYMPDQHRQFFQAQPFLVIAARDDQGRMWSTLLSPSQTTSPDPKNLVLHNAQPVAGDALEGMLQPGTDIGMIGIEFATKRRNRVNGRLVATRDGNNNKLVFQVDQSFGNCPQYIKPRQWWIAANDTNTNTNTNNQNATTTTHRSDRLSKDQVAKIKAAETIFVASGYRDYANGGDDPRYGNDASHRGGPEGFVNVRDDKTLILPDYAGNQHFNTIGNLVMDPRIGITFPEYETGAMLQVTGRARVVEFTRNNSLLAALYPGAERLIEIRIDQVVDVPPGSIPIRWSSSTDELLQRKLVVSAKIRESDSVMSFHLRPQDHELQTLWKFQPGQHLPVHAAGVDPLNDPEAAMERTYTISAGPDWGEYRISVKRQGKVSSFLHSHIQVGDTLLVDKPAGDFVLKDDNHRPLVLLSNGIGVTPMISMLHHWANPDQSKKHCRPVYWIHGARDSQHHPFDNEVQEIQNLVKGSERANLYTHVAYSQPLDGDTEYDSQGRLTADRVQAIVPDLRNADIYMCGTDAFVADMEEGLKAAGVPSAQIRYETF